jgi:hypothetical protein
MYYEVMQLTDNDFYEQALAKAKADLSGVLNDITRLAQQKAYLESFIAVTERMVNPLSLVAGVPPKAVAIERHPQPIWKSIVQNIGDKADSFSVNDAIEALDRAGHTIESVNNKFQIVRTVLMKKTENFEKLTVPGRFRIKKNPSPP